MVYFPGFLCVKKFLNKVLQALTNQCQQVKVEGEKKT
jgi:hypothetical protein